MIVLLRSAMQHLAGFSSIDEYSLYTYDRDALTRLSSIESWTDEDKRQALFMFAKYRRILIHAGYDYHMVFPRNKDNHDLVMRTKKVYEYMDYLVKTHNIKPPRAFDLMQLEDVEQWVRDKIIEVRILNAKRNGCNATTTG